MPMPQTEFINVLGFAAGTLTTLSFVPQVHKAWQTRRCDDLSTAMLLSFGAGVLLWLVYGLWLRAAPIIAANAVTLALVAVILALKLRYQARSSAKRNAGF
jgi:MtN3 and saliva related transmembrane protein